MTPDGSNCSRCRLISAMNCVGHEAVDQPVVEAERQVGHRADDERVVHHHRPLLDRAHAEDGHLRLVDDGQAELRARAGRDW